MGKCKCGKEANFGFVGTPPIYCTNCKKYGMMDIVHKRCECGKHCSYGIKGEKATHCVKCKTNDMIDLKNRKCECGKTPSYGINGNKAFCCVTCKTEKMTNIVDRMCTCGKRPYFGFIGDVRPTCCSGCKTEGMTNIKDKLCKCGKTPNFGIEGSRATCCMKCKTDDMINVKHRKCKCGKQTCFKLPGGKLSTHCIMCRTEGMIDTKYKRCLSKFCDTRVEKKYDGYCTHCFSNLFPEDPRTALIQTNSKEIKVVSYISQSIEGFVHDKPLYMDFKGGCCNSRRRIDLRKLVGNTMLCVEIDENEHRYYDGKDELNRYDNLFMDFSGKYIFIRYNPDKFKNGSKVNNPRFETRMIELVSEINKHTKRINKQENKEFVEIHRLYFSSF
jgi:hypothetical protein